MFVVFFMVLSNIIFSQVKLNSTAPILRLFLSACGHLKRSCDFCADSNYVNYSELLASFFIYAFAVKLLMLSTSFHNSMTAEMNY